MGTGDSFGRDGELIPATGNFCFAMRAIDDASMPRGMVNVPVSRGAIFAKA